MDEVDAEDLASDVDAVLGRVQGGESIVITRLGNPVAELHSAPPPTIDRATLLTRWRPEPRLDPTRLRHDLDATIDPST